MNYQGVPCPICGKELSEKDDIVVCPDCGAPYHRACYLSTGHCVMEDLHRQHKDWENPNDVKARSVTRETVIICPVCGQPNPAENTTCEQCGQVFSNMDPEQSGPDSDDPRAQAYQALFEQIDPDSTVKDVPVREIIWFTQNNYLYFVRLFKLLSARASSVVFNWSAFCFGSLYFFYRKMHRYGIMVLLAMFAARIPSFVLAYHLAPQVIANPALMHTFAFDTTGLETLLSIATLCSYIPFIVHIICGFNANRLYYQHAMSSIRKIHQEVPNQSPSELEHLITRRGGVSPVAVCFAMLGLVACLVLISLLISLKIMMGA